MAYPSDNLHPNNNLYPSERNNMAIGDDFRIDENGDIRYVGAAHGQQGAGYYTVIEFHRWLQDLADNAVAYGDDILDITDSTPSERSTDNIITLLPPYNIDDDTAEHLYDGSIIQDNGDTIYDGIVNYGNEGINIQIIQNGQLILNDFWNTTPYGESTPGLNRDTAAGISHRFMIKVRSGGQDIDGRRLIGISREYGKTYAEFVINGTNRGNNVLALSNSIDLNNQTDAATVGGWTDIQNLKEGYSLIDVDNDGTAEPYYSKWDKGSHSINDLYEYAKYLTRTGSNATLYGLNAQIFRGVTHEIPLTSSSGTWQEPEKVTWNGGSGQLLAIDSTSSPTKMWIQILTGTAPNNGDTITGETSGASASVNGSVIDRTGTINPVFLGTSTGSAIIGTYGVGIEASDLSASDKVFDLDNVQHTAPNYVTFTVNGLVANEDRVLVAPEENGAIKENQLTLAVDLAGGETEIQVNEDIPSDTPQSGTIRVFDGLTYARVTYTGWSGKTFTGCDGTPLADSGANIFISYIDDLATSSSISFTTIYASDRSLFVRVRDGGATPIKTFETTATLGSSGGSVTAIRTSDE